MYTGPLRFLRSLAVSTTCLVLSLTAHFSGAHSGGPMVSVGGGLGLLLTVTLLTLFMAALSGRRWTLGRSLLALTVGQAGLHVIFTALLPFSPSGEHAAMPDMALTQGASMSMVLAHAGVALLIALGIAVNDSAIDAFFHVASSLVGSGLSVLSPWRLVALIPIADETTRVRPASRAQTFTRWQRPRILTDLVVLQCLSRRGPPALTLGF
jgi:hypothetical protein